MVSFACGLVSLCQVTSHVLRIAGEAQLIVHFQDDPLHALKLRVQARFAACQANMLCAKQARLPSRLTAGQAGDHRAWWGNRAGRGRISNHSAWWQTG